MIADSTYESHFSYSLPDADLVLLSSDGVQFRVHSNIMKSGSGMFRGMLESSYDSGEPIRMEEENVIIENMLSTIYPDRACPMVDSLDILKRLTFAALKYDAPAVVAHGQLLFKLNPLFRRMPLEMYMFACECGWEEEAKIASTWTLETDLNSQDALDILEKIDTRSVFKLQRLHRIRKDQLDRAIKGRIPAYVDYPPIPVYQYVEAYSDVTLTICMWNIITQGSGDCKHELGQSSWNVLRLAVLAEMEKCSAGTIFRSPHFWDRAEIQAALWDEVCTHCGTRCLQRKETVKEFLRVLDLLPTTI